MADSDLKTRRTSEARERPLLMNENEAAELLGFSVRTLQTWRFRGGGPQFIRVSSRCIRYRREDLEAWIEERTRRTTSDPGPERLPTTRGGERVPAEE